MLAMRMAQPNGLTKNSPSSNDSKCRGLLNLRIPGQTKEPGTHPRARLNF